MDQTPGRRDLEELRPLMEWVRAHGPVVITVAGQRLVLCREEDLPDRCPAPWSRDTSIDNAAWLRKGRSDGTVSTSTARDAGRSHAAIEVFGEVLPLTPRQREVLALAAAGQTTHEIGLELGIATQTVRVHLNAARSACAAYGVSSTSRNPRDQ